MHRMRPGAASARSGSVSIRAPLGTARSVGYVRRLVRWVPGLSACEGEAQSEGPADAFFVAGADDERDTLSTRAEPAARRDRTNRRQQADRMSPIEVP